MMKRHKVQVLRRAGVTQEKVAELAGISVRAVRMIEAEEPVVVPDDEADRENIHHLLLARGRSTRRACLALYGSSASPARRSPAPCDGLGYEIARGSAKLIASGSAKLIPVRFGESDPLNGCPGLPQRRQGRRAILT